MRTRIAKLVRLDADAWTETKRWGGLKPVFGDCFLLTRNDIYRTVRLRSIDVGLVFSQSHDSPDLNAPNWADRLTDSKSPIYFLPDAPAIRRAARLQPRLELEFLQYFRPNFLLHHSVSQIFNRAFAKSSWSNRTKDDLRSYVSQSVSIAAIQRAKSEEELRLLRYCTFGWELLSPFQQSRILKTRRSRAMAPLHEVLETLLRKSPTYRQRSPSDLSSHLTDVMGFDR